MDSTKALYLQPYSSASQGFEIIPMEQHQHHHAPPPRPPGPPIKVNLKSNCLNCQVKLKKKLQKMSGVNDVDIVPEQGGTVTVSGSIDSKVLMEVIRNNYKKAKLLCPFDQKEPSENTVGKKFSCSDDEHDDSEDGNDHNFAVNNSNNEAGLSEPKKEKKTKMCSIMRCFGKKSNPMAMRPPPPAPSPEPRPPMGFPTNGFFLGPPRPGFRPGMPWMPPIGPPPPYGYLGRPPLPTDYGYPFPRSPPRLNPMVHYTSYKDNYCHPY